MIKLKIADLIIQLNMPIKLLHDNMYSFLYKGPKEADINWKLRFDNKYDIREMPCVHTKELNIFNKNDVIVYEYKNEPNVPFMIVAKNGYTDCTFYLNKSYENMDKYTSYIEKYIKLCLFNVFREMFILACSLKSRLPLHSSSILYDDKAYLFSAPSGTGKSTHSELWKKEYECEVLNGDIAILRYDKENKKTIAYGCPWCGTSGIFMNKEAQVGGIAFLKQGDNNTIYLLEKEDVGIKLLDNHFVPFITKEVVEGTVKSINMIGNNVKGYLLTCRPDVEAAKVAKNAMVR